MRSRANLPNHPSLRFKTQPEEGQWNSSSLKVWRRRRRGGWMHISFDIFPILYVCLIWNKWKRKWNVSALLLQGLTEWHTNWLAAGLPGWLSASFSCQSWWTVFPEKSLAALWVEHRAIWQTCLTMETDVSRVSGRTSVISLYLSNPTSAAVFDQVLYLFWWLRITPSLKSDYDSKKVLVIPVHKTKNVFMIKYLTVFWFKIIGFWLSILESQQECF